MVAPSSTFDIRQSRSNTANLPPKLSARLASRFVGSRRDRGWWIAILALAVAVDIWWVVRDHQSPFWDQSHYLDTMLRYRNALSDHGVLALGHTIRTFDPGHAPLFPVLGFPFFYLFGPSVHSALLLNLILLPVLIGATGAIASHLFGSRSGLLAMFAVATMPLVVGLSHEALQDFLVITVATVMLLVLLKTDWLRRRPLCIALGAAIGIGMLTKVTFLVYVLGPLIVSAIARVMSLTGASPEGSDRRREVRTLLLNGACILGVAFAIAAPWYIANWGPTLDYVRSTTGGPLVVGIGPDHPFRIHEVTLFAQQAAAWDIGWLVTFLGAVLALIAVPRLVRWVRSKSERRETLLRCGFLVAWVAVPFWVFALSKDHDLRYLGPTMPGVAVIVAGLIVQIHVRSLRRLMVGALLLVATMQTAMLTTAFRVPFVPAQVNFDAPAGPALLSLAGQPIGYERLPSSKDYGDGIVDYLVRRSAQSKATAPRTIGILQEHPIVNGNTLTWIADKRDLPFTFIQDFVMSPRSVLLSQLASCDFVLYIPQQHLPSAISGDLRLTLLNQNSIAAHMTPQIYALFGGSSARLPIGDGLDVRVLERSSIAQQSGKQPNAASKHTIRWR